jgi:hypothetical protein
VSPPLSQRSRADREACIDCGICSVWIGFLEVLLGVGPGSS